MARPDDLIPGNCYFLLNFYDKDLVVPNIETWIYQKKSQDDSGKDVWLFVEPSDLDNGSEDNVALLGLDENQLYMLLDIHGLQKGLFEIEDLHPIVEHPKKMGTVVEHAEPDFAILEKEIAKFLKSEGLDGLTITIKYTGHGLSLIKRNGGIDLFVSINWKIHPEREQNLRTFLRSQNLIPHEDYLANRGRVRLLTYSLPRQESALINLISNAFKEVYKLDAGDQFEFHYRD